MYNVAPGPFNRIMFFPVTDSFHGILSFVLASGCVRKAHPGGCILPQYVHGSVPGGGELTWVVRMHVVDLESRGACARCEDFSVALTLLPEGPYGEVDVILEEV